VRCRAAYNRGVSAQEKTQRVLALDVGAKRIGLAVTDELGITAQPLQTLVRENKRKDFAALQQLAEQLHITDIVIGMPLRMSGEAGTQAEKIQAFAADLRKYCSQPIHFYDERLTSAEANRMLDAAGLTRIDRKGLVDQMAAVMILQGWMQRNRNILSR
jgi:putative Holliday junction resolvase